MGIELSGFAYDSAGAPLTSKAVKVYDKNTTANARASTTTHGTTGAWTVSNADVTVSSVYQMDVEITDGDNKVRYKYDDEIMLQRVDVKDLVLRSGSASQYVGGIATTTLTADRTWTFPNATGDILVSSGAKLDGTAMFINETTNANMTTGITIKGTTTNEHLSFKKAVGLAHGLTDYGETDTYGYVTLSDLDKGGLKIVGITDTAQADSNDAGIVLQGMMRATADDSTNNTAMGCVSIVGIEHDGSNAIDDIGAQENILVLKKGIGTDDTTHIFEGNGDILVDGAVSAFDDYDDVALLTAWNGAVANENRYKEEFKEWVDEHLPTLEQLKIVHPNKNGSFHYSIKNLNSLMVGAIRQLSSKVNDLETKLALKGGS